MTEPYCDIDGVQVYLGDCREVTEWLTADVLVTDPPYGIGWKRGAKASRGDAGSGGIVGDRDVSLRDEVLTTWGHRPGLVFGSFDAPEPVARRHTLVYRKPPDAGAIGSTTGWRRDLEPVYVLDGWPKRIVQWSSLIVTGQRSAGNPSGPAGRTGHPHCKPIDVMETLIARCPPGVIADPFAGSGSTLVAARNLGRRAIGVEIEERYCEVIAKRLAQGCLDLEGAPA